MLRRYIFFSFNEQGKIGPHFFFKEISFELILFAICALFLQKMSVLQSMIGQLGRHHRIIAEVLSRAINA